MLIELYWSKDVFVQLSSVKLDRPSSCELIQLIQISAERAADEPPSTTSTSGRAGLSGASMYLRMEKKEQVVFCTRSSTVDFQ